MNEKNRQREAAHEKKKTPSAGPHAKPELTNDEATPGAGTLPPVGNDDENIQPTS